MVYMTVIRLGRKRGGVIFDILPVGADAYKLILISNGWSIGTCSSCRHLFYPSGHVFC